MIAFPNILQHRVDPFELKDKSRPGHRRILVLWLVDPHRRIISTATVAPQQRSWWEDEVFRSGERLEKILPQELQLDVLDRVDEPMTLKEAKEIRLELMAERTAVADHVMEKCTDAYNFCEH